MKWQGDGQRHREAGQVVTRMDEGVGQDRLHRKLRGQLVSCQVPSEMVS